MEKGWPLLPPWYRVLELAEKWGKFPWEIDPSTPAVLWIIRANFIESVKAQIHNKQQKQNRKHWQR